MTLTPPASPPPADATVGAPIVPAPVIPRRAQALIAVLAVGVITFGAMVLADPARTEAATAPGLAAAVEPTGNTTEVTVGVDGMSFTPDTIEVPAGDRLLITFDNTGDQRHDLVLANGTETGSIAPGDTAVLDAGVIGSSMEGWCSLAGHRAMGMELDVVALGAAGASDDAGTTDDAAAAPRDMPGMMSGDGSTGPEVAAPSMVDLLAAAKDAEPMPAELQPLTDETLREYTFTVTESTETVADGVTRAIWTYNGTSPGPTLHGRVGDTFRITLVNAGTMGHSIDFHAGELAPDGPMRTIEPGESLVYEFTAGRAGIWMYHCGTMPMTQHIANGMFGAVVIEPDGLEPVDRQYVLIQSEMYLGSEGGTTSPTKAAAVQPDVVAFNGRAFQYAAHPLTAVAGERVRMWVLDAGPNADLSFHVVGTQFDTVWNEGSYSVYRGASTDGITQGVTGAQVLPLLAAQGGFVEFVPPEAGHYAIVNHKMSLAEKGAKGVLEVTAAP
ncbi:multicopper oxidase domain-containing protein [Demequina sp. TTPB684]|uniref:multicopper oxidase domain-containing protein n=1 Tax=unclassified Demequina TaxID=2620311 RepID=UPI001CF36D1C|nr:multicopper oxidase domain-containing protein [Demequina sp. TMPB413]MCB2411685.1 multicopper oxidase domain-containing protein [Demequina sp. TTPB684]UPU88918.1 multicopper oxidase domain-containing protein [Demequina sp. TMPB413]